jgi:ABC-type branched-subunit amino acid transport system substrate-binding protein
VAISYPQGQAQLYLKEALENGLIDQFIFVDGTKDDEMFAALGWGQFDGMKGTAPGALPPANFSSAFDELYEAEFGSLYQVAFVREMYDAVIALALAAEAAGSTDGTAIRDELRNVGNAPGTEVDAPPEGIADALEAVRNGDDVDYNGASGSVEWDDNGDVLLGAIEIWNIDAAGEQLVVEGNFKVDLEADTVEELPAAEEPSPTSSMRLDLTVDRVMRLDPVLQRALRSLT